MAGVWAVARTQCLPWRGNCNIFLVVQQSSNSTRLAYCNCTRTPAHYSSLRGPISSLRCAPASLQGDFHEYKKSILKDFKDKKAHPAAEQYEGK